MNREALVCVLLVAGFFVGLVVYTFLRWRPLKPRPGTECAFSANGGVQVGLRFVSPPLARIELWGDELLISNMDLRVPVSDVREVRIQEKTGGKVALLTLEDPSRDPIEIVVGRPDALAEAVAAAKRETRGSETRGSGLKDKG